MVAERAERHRLAEALALRGVDAGAERDAGRDEVGGAAGIDALIVDAAAKAAVVGEVAGDTHGQVGGQVGLELGAEAIGLLVRCAVAQVAVVVGRHRRQAEGAVVAERQVDRALGVDRVVVAVVADEA